MRYYTISFEKDGTWTPDAVYTHDEMISNNSDDPEFIARLEAMKPGDTIRDGGGAQPLIEVTCGSDYHPFKAHAKYFLACFTCGKGVENWRHRP